MFLVLHAKINNQTNWSNCSANTRLTSRKRKSIKPNFGVEMKNEIILYRPNELAEHIEVKVENETVWLTQQQMSLLFCQTKQNISLHINNCFKEKELEPNSVVKESLTTAKDGKKYSIKFYNLDVIISVGYRVKSKQGTQFRIWANTVLKDYLLKGYSLNNRMNRLEDNLESIKNKVNEIDFQISSNLIPPKECFLTDRFLMLMHLPRK